MDIGIIGLGKMGLNLARNLKDKKFEVKAFDQSTQAMKKANTYEITTYDDMDKMIEDLKNRKIIFLSIPAGKVTNETILELLTKVNHNDIIIDMGNSYYKDSIANFNKAKNKNIHFLDCGISGGKTGARYGACLMVGGDKEVFDQIEDIIMKIACNNGYLYAGPAGSGHYLKMIHNGIEYGMMQAIGEGFELLDKSKYDFDFEEVARVWNNGSVIRSWLMELAEISFSEYPNLEEIKGVVDASGEGKWTVEEALNLNIPVPVITSALYARNASKINNSFSAKVVASMRNQFGGHELTRKDD